MSRCLHAVLAAACCSLASGATLPLDFETDADTGAWTATGGTQSVTDQAARSGRRSLRWEPREAGASLTLTDPALRAWARLSAKELGEVSFALWLRASRDSGELVRGELLGGGQVVAAGWWPLDFVGWRPLGAPLAAWGLRPGAAVDAVRLSVAPAAGVLHIDYLQPSLRQLPGLNVQHPWVGRDAAEPAQARLSTRDFAVGRPWLPRRPAELSTAQRAELDTLTQRLATPALAPGRGTGLAPGQLQALTDAVRRDWGIEVQADGSLRGPGTSASLFHPVPGGKSTREYLLLLGQFRNAAARAKADEWPAVQPLLVDLVRFTLDQGMAYGSGFAEPFGPYGLRNHLGTFRDLRGCLPDPVLRRAFLLQLIQLMACGQDARSSIFGPTPYGDTDLLHGYHNYLPAVIAGCEDPLDRWQLWDIYRWAMDYVVLSPDLTEPDGGMYHHGMVHHGYSGYTFPGLIGALTAFRDTSLRPAPATLRRLKEVALWQAWTSQGTVAPNVCYARPGSSVGTMGAGAYLALARFGSADGQEPLDRDLVGICLARVSPDDAEAKRLLAAGYRPSNLSGHRPFNSMGDTMHRRGNWLVAIAGSHSQRAHAEVYGWLEDGTTYAPYVLNGGTMVITRDAAGKVDTGFDERGWDWCHWPGTTAARHTSAELFAQYTWFGNQRPLSGAAALDQDGVWALDMVPSNGGLQDVRCRKSAFCFGDRLTFVTTDIAGGGAQAKLTTLYQHRLAESPAATWLDGAVVRDCPAAEQRLATDRLHWLLDGRGNGYLVHPGGGRLVVRRQPQEWLYLYRRYLRDPARNPKATNSTSVRWVEPGTAPEKVLPTPKGRRYPPAVEAYYEPSRGNFALAYLDHGPAPGAAADNTFTLVPQTTPERLAALAAALADERTAPYRLLRRASDAHVLYDVASATWGYALFEATRLSACGPLLTNSRPCFALARGAGDELVLSAASSDGQANGAVGVEMTLGTAGPLPAGEPLGLTLAGGWQVASVSNPGAQVTATLAADGQSTALALKLPWRLSLVVRLRPTRR